MFTKRDTERIANSMAHGPDGALIGRVHHVYTDDETREPVWITLHTGLFGHLTHFAPLVDAHFDGNELVLAHTRDEIIGSPEIVDDLHLDDADEAALTGYYRLGASRVDVA